MNVSGGSITFGASPTALGDYRLIAATLGQVHERDQLQPAGRPRRSNETYALSTSVDPGYLDLVVASAATFSGSATWVSNGSNPVWSNSSNWTDGDQPWCSGHCR